MRVGTTSSRSGLGGTQLLQVLLSEYVIMPGKVWSTAIIDAAHLTNPSTRGVMLASVVQGADREIYLKCLSVCGGAETNNA